MATKLHIPTAPFRPGDKPDFSSIKLPRAGELGRPDPHIHANDTRDLSFSMIRVLDDNHRALGAWDPRLDPETLRKGLRYMLLTRTFDDFMYKKQRQGKFAFYLKSTGEEAVSVAQCMALEPGDMLFPSYRQQGLLITRDVSLVDMMCQCLSNSRDNLKGRQLSVLYSFREVNFFTISGNLATQCPQAVGWAMAAEYKGTRDIAVSWTGEGSSAEADFHYAMTFASVYRAPTILNVVNNQWALSTYQNVAGGDQNPFAARGIGYGVPGLRVDGNDFLAVYAATKWAAERAREGTGPTLIEHYTYRAAPHSTSDDPGRYRPLDEWQYWPLGDPVARLRDHLIALGEWSAERHAVLEQELAEHVNACWKEAESYGTLNDGPLPPVAAMFEDVYKEMPLHLRKQRKELLGE
jgi:2-oxoisovalerate dehydrogenase E1 component alpha subunit